MRTVVTDQTGTSPLRRALILTALCLAVLVAQVDTTVVNLAIHAIRLDLGATKETLQWVIDGYNLAYAALILTGGLLADLKGRRLIFTIGAGIFAAASLACALAPSAAALIAGRVAGGAAAALLVPASLAIIRVVWIDPAERGRALGLWASCNGLALVIGPPLGGALIQHLGWQSIFILVMALSVAAFGLGLFTIPESADPADRHFDASAQACGALALAAIVFAAIQYRASPAAAVGAVAMTMIAGWRFIAIERGKGAVALVPLDMFGSRTFCGALIAAASMTFGMFGVFFLVPQAWQVAGGMNTATAGLLLLPMALPILIVSPYSGGIMQRLGGARVVGGGVIIIGAGLTLIASGAAAQSLWPTELGLMLAGLGMGVSAGPMAGLAVGAVTRERAGTAAALNNVARMVGAAMGVAFLGSIYAEVNGGMAGLAVALGLGGLVQVAGGTTAWVLIRSSPSPASVVKTQP